MEAAYRQTGEHIRQLPTITPPDSFRAAVFAAIRAEDARLGRTIERVASDDTQPSLPALRPTPVRTWSPRGAVLGARAAIAIAAVLLLGLSLARLAPAVVAGTPRLASYLSGALSAGQTSGPHSVQYQVAPASAKVTSAMASGHWLVYVASDAQARSVVYARERGTAHTFALPGAQTSSALTLRAVTDGWVIWQAGSGQSSAAWALWASPLSANGTPLALADSHSASALSGVWAQGSVVLAAYTTPTDGSVLARFDLTPGRAAPSPSVIAHAQAPTHLLADPSLSGTTYYWSEVWYDSGSGLRGDIWRTDSTGTAQALTSGGTSFAPRTTAGTLVWVETSGPASVAPAVAAGQPVEVAEQTLIQVGGVLRARDLAGTTEHAVAAHALAGSVQVAGSLVLWHDGNQMHTFDLARGAPSLVDASIRSAGYASANGGSLAWGQAGSSTISIYDGR
jgi:hypothetical protein